MKVQLKVKRNRYKWEDVDAKELLNRSVIDYILEEFDPTMAALTNDEGKALLVVSNTEDLREYYENKNIIYLMANEMKYLLGGHIGPALVIHTFEGSTLFDIKTIEPEKE